MPVGIEEIDGLEDTMISRPEHVEPLCPRARLSLLECVQSVHLESDMLHPLGSIRIPSHIGLCWKLEEGEHVAAAGVEKHMNVRVVGASRGYVILGESQLELHTQHVSVERHRLSRIPTAVGEVVND